MALLLEGWVDRAGGVLRREGRGGKGVSGGRGQTTHLRLLSGTVVLAIVAVLGECACMSVEIGSKSDLRRVLIGTKKPVSFLVGAPISWDGGAGVPPVAGFIGLIRDRVVEAGPDFVQAFEEKLAEPNAQNAYQKAMSFLQMNFDPEDVEDIVKRAVLMARKPDAPEFKFPAHGEGDPTHWCISSGIRGLARLIKTRPEQFSGPIFTTNFDPLIWLALDDSGMRPASYAIPLDGSVNVTATIRDDEINIFHLHGYWRNSPTLHTPAQLTSDRPQLQQSLQDHLGETTLLVIAYGGWDDVFTTALANCFINKTFTGSIRWCFYGLSHAEIREQNAALFEKFKWGVQQNRVAFYAGIDCHTVFDDLLDELGIAPAELAAIEESPLVGWDHISSAYLDQLEPLRDDEAVRYFDGAVPTWRHAESPLVPRLSHVDTLTERLAEGLGDKAAATLQLIRAAGGEGKSTALLQGAVDAAHGGDWTVLGRTSTETGLNPEVVTTLDPDRNWLLVADDAEGLVDDLWASAERLHQEGRSNVFFLIAARDADWRGKNGDRKPWASRLNQLDDLEFRGIGEEDAAWVVDAWAAQGEAGLRALAEAGSREERVAKLVSASRAQDVRRGDGSFFGGLLAMRFSDPALRAHVVSLMEPLRDRVIEEGAGTLYSALIYIAACHSVGIPGVAKKVLASLLKIPVRRVSSEVVRNLGAELGAAESAGHVLTRHRRVAEAIIVASEENFDTDLCDVWADLVEHTSTRGREPGKFPQSHGPIIHAGARLKRDLPRAISEERRVEIGIAAAEAAVQFQPEWLGCIVNLGKTYRYSGYPDQAAQVFRDETLARIEGHATKKFDMKRVLRGFYYEWGTCEGNIAGRQAKLADAWLACMSVSDPLKVDIDLQRAKLTCAGLGVAFGDLQSGRPDCVFAKGRRAVTELGWRTSPDRKTAGYFARYERELDEIGAPKPRDVDESIDWLEAAARASYEDLADPFLRGLHKGGQLTFMKLHDLLGPLRAAQ